MRRATFAGMALRMIQSQQRWHTAVRVTRRAANRPPFFHRADAGSLKPNSNGPPRTDRTVTIWNGRLHIPAVPAFRASVRCDAIAIAIAHEIAQNRRLAHKIVQMAERVSVNPH